MTGKSLPQESTGVPQGRSINLELDRILASSTFANSGRLKAFLSYVVKESLAGNANRIAGKTIAHDVYGRGPDDGSDSIVRVDAGRLRRKLSEYYDEEGANDPTRIHIDSGGYAPRFEAVEPAQENPACDASATNALPQRRGDLPRLIIGGLALAMLLVVGALLRHWQKSPDVSPVQDYHVQNELERSALAEKSTATLQAANLAEMASGLLFPIANIEHQTLATSMYREAIRIDPGFPDGFAGAAHSVATLALLAPNEQARVAFLDEADAFADTAIDLDPRSGWSQSAAAWVAYVKGDYDRAVELSRRAISLDDLDGKTLDFHGAIMVTTGHFEEAARISDPMRPRNNKGRHPAHLNIYGVANFHLGNYELAIKSFDEAIQQGGPVSEFTLMYKAAASQALGNTLAARALLAELEETWPSFRPEMAVGRFYPHKSHAEQVLTKLQAAGWTQEE